MTTASPSRPPTPDEYAEYYHGYISKLPAGDVVETLRAQRDAYVSLFADIPESKVDYRYAPGKWTTKEVVGHVIDAEWIFTYRALRFARADPAELPGMDQDEFMKGANFAQRDFAGMIDEFQNLRSAGIALFGSFDESIWSRTGIASNFRFTVRALAYIVAGHGMHHVGVLKERYL